MTRHAFRAAALIVALPHARVSLYGSPGSDSAWVLRPLSGSARMVRRRWGASVGAVSTEAPHKVDPVEHVVIVFMINQLPNASDIAAKFPTLVYQAIADAKAGSGVVQR